MATKSLGSKLARSVRKRVGLHVEPKFSLAALIASERKDAEASQYAAEAALADARKQTDELSAFVDQLPSVLQYRRAYFETYGHIAPGAGLPSSRAWPNPNNDLSYPEKLTSLLLLNGRGAEIGPLNLPLIPRDKHDVLYVDHLDTAGLKTKYTAVTGIVDVDRPMVNNSISETLKDDGPLDYICASQVFEHVPNPIRWLNEAAQTLKIGGLVSLSIPDRRGTFDLFRSETTAADIVSAYYRDVTSPDVRAVYDHQSMATAINTHGMIVGSLKPAEVYDGRGAVVPVRVGKTYLEITKRAHDGDYLDAHCWVFTSPGFLLVMAQIAGDGFIPFRCRQFYPTNFSAPGRDNHSFTVILEKVAPETDLPELRRSFLMALGE